MIRGLRRRTIVLVAAVAVIGGLAGPASATTGWVLQTTVNAPGGTLDQLSGVSCTAASACTAVGDYENSAGVMFTLAERWNGSTWAIQTTPNPSGATEAGFTGVSCTSATWCTAVGITNAGTLVEHWNGSTWAIQSAPSPAGLGLDGISCASTSSCTAVGSYESSGEEFALAEHWNGSTWATQTVPAPSGNNTYLSSVSCPSTTSCVAMGTTKIPVRGAVPEGLTEVWNGSTWSVADYGGTTALACVSASSCEGVGLDGEYAGAYHWNGSTWTAQTVPSSVESALYSISCTSASFCVAVGETVSTDYYTLADEWNGSTWSLMTTPNPSGSTAAMFEGVSCPSTTDCTAVGNTYTSPSQSRTLGAQWTG